MAESIQAVQDLLSNEKKKGGAVRLEDFFWDHFLRYIGSLILALTVLNVTVEFLRGGGIFCFPPSNNAAIDNQNLQGDMVYEFGPGQTNYINNYCARIILKTEYFPIYILIHGILLLIPHYIWSSFHRGDFESFFSVVNKLDHLRDETGEYDSNKFEIVARLELEYKEHKSIFSSYILKLLVQLAVCIGSLGFSSLFFLDCDIAFTFCCPDVNICVTPETTNLSCSRNISGDIPNGWPLSINVPCIYTSLRILNLVRYADLCLLIIASLLIMVGLVWCFVRHTKELGHEDIAKFSFHSCLNAHFHNFPSLFYWPMYKCCIKQKDDLESSRTNENDDEENPEPEKQHWTKKMKYWTKKMKYYALWPVKHYPDPHLKHMLRPRIENDLDFLVLMLFRADTAHGQIFKSIQISKDSKTLIERDNQQLHLFVDAAQAAVSVQDNFHKCFHKYDQTLDPAFSDRQVQRPDESTADQDSTDQKEPFRNPEKDVFDKNRMYLGNLRCVADLFSDMRCWIYYCVSAFGPKCGTESLLRNNLAVDISFGSAGFAPVLARPYEKVISLDISSNAEKISEIKHFYKALRLPDSSYAHGPSKINEVEKELEKAIGQRHIVDFVVVGPLIQSPRKVTVNLLLNLLFPKYTGEEACLLIVRPLKVGSRKLTKQFPKYHPHKKLFHQNFNSDFLQQKAIAVDGSKGIEIKINGINCVFEFEVYKYNVLGVSCV